MRTSYRDIALLACCQALLLINNAGLIAMNGLVGYALVDNKVLATLGATTFVLGSALAAMPAALWMAKVGRRRGFMATGAASLWQPVGRSGLTVLSNVRCRQLRCVAALGRSATVEPGGRDRLLQDYTSVCSAISSASSTSIPRYLTVLSSLL